MSQQGYSSAHRQKGASSHRDKKNISKDIFVGANREGRLRSPDNYSLSPERGSSSGQLSDANLNKSV